jgi:hypothetical protein
VRKGLTRAWLHSTQVLLLRLPRTGRRRRCVLLWGWKQRGSAACRHRSVHSACCGLLLLLLLLLLSI